MSAILGNITLLVTEAISWVGDFVTCITGNPLLELFVVTAFVGTGVGLINRIIKL